MIPPYLTPAERFNVARYRLRRRTPLIVASVASVSFVLMGTGCSSPGEGKQQAMGKETGDTASEVRSAAGAAGAQNPIRGVNRFYQTYDEVRQATTRRILVPTALPVGFQQFTLQSVTFDYPDSAFNGSWVIFVFGFRADDGRLITLDQRAEPTPLPGGLRIGPGISPTAKKGDITVHGRPASWHEGNWVAEGAVPSRSDMKWDQSGITLEWSEDSVALKLQGTGTTTLEDLILVANSVR